MKKIICIILAASLIACGEKETKGKQIEAGKGKQEQTASYEESINEVKKARHDYMEWVKKTELTMRKRRPDYIDYKSREWMRKHYIEEVGKVYERMKNEGFIGGQEYEMKMLNLREEAKDITSPDY